MPHTVPLIQHLLAESFDFLALHAAHPQRYPCLLESVSGKAEADGQARYDILFAFPGERLTLTESALLSDADSSVATHDFLNQLDHCWQSESASLSDTCDLPFQGGWFVYLGYELAHQVEPSLPLLKEVVVNDVAMPVACAIRIPVAIIQDHQTQQCTLIAEAGHEEQLSIVLEDIAKLELMTQGTQDGPDNSLIIGEIKEDAPEQFLAGVERIKDYIVEGDVFQVNLSRLWSAQLERDVTAHALYQRLRQHNPAPFAGLFVFNEQTALISSSPERLVRVRGDIVDTRPIAGTRSRSNELDQDALLLQTLITHPKERAEHIMLIDLERNDLGRICVPGSVHVDEMMVVESYAHVHHIVSNVQGRRSAGVTPGDVLRAVFPGGTITGCPKVRCMEIISELEQMPRGPYTGAMGYLNRDGSMDFNIMIRSMLKRGDTLSFRAGAGIVADSVAIDELAETRAKARGLLLALS